MPEEHKVSRTYHEALRRLGIKNPGEVRVGTPVALQANVDELSHLTPPIQVPVVALYFATAAVAGSYSGLELHSKAAGCWIEYISQFDATGPWLTYPAPTRGDTSDTLLVPVTTFGPPMASEFHSVQSTTNPLAVATAFNMRSNWQSSPGWFVPPGQILAAFDDAVNALHRAAMIVREVPLRSPGSE